MCSSSNRREFIGSPALASLSSTLFFLMVCQSHSKPKPDHDSTAFDPHGRLVLDVIANPPAAAAKRLLIENNRCYGIGFTIVEDRHECGGDHVPFAAAGFSAIRMKLFRITGVPIDLMTGSPPPDPQPLCQEIEAFPDHSQTYILTYPI